MQDPTKPLTDIVNKIFTLFKEGDFDSVQDILRSKAYYQTVQQLAPQRYMAQEVAQSLDNVLSSDIYVEKLSQVLSTEQLHRVTNEALNEVLSSQPYIERMKAISMFQPLKETMMQLSEYVGVATRPDIRERLDEKALKSIGYAIDMYQNMGKNDSASSLLGGGMGFIGQKADSTTDQLNTLLKGVVQNVAAVVQKIDKARLIQAKFVSDFEEALFKEKEGWKEYYLDMVQRRWLGDHHAGKTLIDGILSPPTNVAECVTLEGKALEEFGKVTILNTPLKQVGAGLASVAGVGLVAHGVHNVYRAFKTDPQEKLELVELNHERPTDGVNRLQLAVGGGEIIAGIATLHRQLTGRWGVGAIKGTPDPLITHTPPSIGRG